MTPNPFSYQSHNPLDPRRQPQALLPAANYGPFGSGLAAAQGNPGPQGWPAASQAPAWSLFQAGSAGMPNPMMPAPQPAMPAPASQPPQPAGPGMGGPAVAGGLGVAANDIGRAMAQLGAVAGGMPVGGMAATPGEPAMVQDIFNGPNLTTYGRDGADRVTSVSGPGGRMANPAGIPQGDLLAALTGGGPPPGTPAPDTGQGVPDLNHFLARRQLPAAGQLMHPGMLDAAIRDQDRASALANELAQTQMRTQSDIQGRQMALDAQAREGELNRQNQLAVAGLHYGPQMNTQKLADDVRRDTLAKTGDAVLAQAKFDEVMRSAGPPQAGGATAAPPAPQDPATRVSKLLSTLMPRNEQGQPAAMNLTAAEGFLDRLSGSGLSEADMGEVARQLGASPQLYGTRDQLVNPLAVAMARSALALNGSPHDFTMPGGFAIYGQSAGPLDAIGRGLGTITQMAPSHNKIRLPNGQVVDIPISARPGGLSEMFRTDADRERINRVGLTAQTLLQALAGPGGPR